jgi:hypothetical protein
VKILCCILRTGDWKLHYWNWVMRKKILGDNIPNWLTLATALFVGRRQLRRRKIHVYICHKVVEVSKPQMSLMRVRFGIVGVYFDDTT